MKEPATSEEESDDERTKKRKEKKKKKESKVRNDHLLKKLEGKNLSRKLLHSLKQLFVKFSRKKSNFQLLNMKDVFGEGTSEDETKEKKKRKKKEMKKEATSEDSDEPTAKKARKNQASQITSLKILIFLSRNSTWKRFLARTDPRRNRRKRTKRRRNPRNERQASRRKVGFPTIRFRMLMLH